MTSGCHNSIMITDRRKFTTKTTLQDFYFPFLLLESIQSHSSGLYSPYMKTPKYSVMSDTGWQQGR